MPLGPGFSTIKPLRTQVRDMLRGTSNDFDFFEKYMEAAFLTRTAELKTVKLAKPRLCTFNTHSNACSPVIYISRKWLPRRKTARGALLTPIVQKAHSVSVDSDLDKVTSNAPRLPTSSPLDSHKDDIQILDKRNYILSSFDLQPLRFSSVLFQINFRLEIRHKITPR